MIEEHNGSETVPVVFKRAGSKTFARMLDGVTITTILLIFVSVALLYLTNISVDMNMSWKDFGYEAVILYIFTVAINLLARSVAKRRGRETKPHEAAQKVVNDNEDEIISKGLRGLERDYCRKWEEDELRDSREKVLSSARISVDVFESEYLKYTGKELKDKQKELGLTDYQLKVIRKAKRIRRLRFDEKYLSATLKGKRRVSPTGEINTSQFEKLHTVKYLFTAFAGVCISASLALDVIANPTYGTVVMCIIKIITILISAVAGMIGGYKLTAEMETEELLRKAVEQKNFIKWCESKILSLDKATISV